MHITVIGGGHMGSAIAKALIAKKIGTVKISTPHKPTFRVSWTPNNSQAIKNADSIIIAVKPAVVMSVLQEISPHLNSNQIVISVAAGIPLKKLTRWTSGHKKIVRTLPNLPAQVFEGMTIWKATPSLTSSDKKIIQRLLNAFGKSIEVKNEDLIDAGCAVSGCGPAFCAAFLDTLSSFAKQSGFTADEAREMALQTLSGSIAYMQKTGVEFDALARADSTLSS